MSRVGPERDSVIQHCFNTRVQERDELGRAPFGHAEPVEKMRERPLFDRSSERGDGEPVMRLDKTNNVSSFQFRMAKTVADLLPSSV